MTTRCYDPVKRGIDILVGTVLLMVTSPLQLLVFVLVRRKLGAPALFRQPRPGRHGTLFTLYKFRTMREVDLLGGLVSDADRLTPFGVWLRSTSLDELPTLWNVVRGDMSLVGPRPLLAQYLTRYTLAEARRHEVRPGVTGPAQIAGRNHLTWAQRLSLDVEYVDEKSLMTDVRILARTVGVALRRTGVTSLGHATMEEFMGMQSTQL